MTPRDRDPAVWAAAYGAAFFSDYNALRVAADGDATDRHKHAIAAATRYAPIHALVADAAVALDAGSASPIAALGEPVCS